MQNGKTIKTRKNVDFNVDIFKDDNFNKYVGSASSNPTSITNKVKIARKVLLDITE